MNNYTYSGLLFTEKGLPGKPRFGVLRRFLSLTELALISTEVSSNGVIYVDKKQQSHKIEMKTLTLAMGLRARTELVLVQNFKGLSSGVYVTGDCLEVRNIYHAFGDAWHLVNVW